MAGDSSTATTVRLLRELRGAPTGILVALAMIRRACGATWLAMATGYDRKTVTKALCSLEAMGYAEHSRRYDGWQLTGAAYQLPLFTAHELEGEPLPLLADDQVDSGQPEAEQPDAELLTAEPVDDAPAAVSGSVHNGRGRISPSQTWGGRGGSLMVNVNDTEPLPLPPPEVGRGRISPSPHGRLRNSASPADRPEAAPLIELLCVRSGCPKPRARQAVLAALAQWCRPRVELNILRWGVYVAHANRERQSIQNPGAFIAAKLEQGQPAPEWVEIDRNTDYEDWRRAEELYAEWDQLEAEQGTGGEA